MGIWGEMSKEPAVVRVRHTRDVPERWVRAEGTRRGRGLG